jgi:hypothetical protein
LISKIIPVVVKTNKPISENFIPCNVSGTGRCRDKHYYATSPSLPAVRAKLRSGEVVGKEKFDTIGIRGCWWKTPTAASLREVS